MIPKTIGRYEVKRELGRGGMATVYLTHDPHFKREVALKVLPREFLHDPTFRERFTQEAETIAALEHPAIVPVYDFGEEEGQPYFVMRYMAGGSLAERLARGRLSLEEARSILAVLAPALDEAHERGIIHRDLKPGNILFDQRGAPYIADFGIAKLTEVSQQFSQTGVATGTPAYMSPEQARGEKKLDARSDIYALGAILFEMLTGQLPYDSDTPMGMALRHISDPIPRLNDVAPDLPAETQQIIDRSMAKQRNDRYATAGALVQALPSVGAAGKVPAAPAAVVVKSPVPPTEMAESMREIPPTEIASSPPATGKGQGTRKVASLPPTEQVPPRPNPADIPTEQLAPKQSIPTPPRPTARTEPRTGNAFPVGWVLGGVALLAIVGFLGRGLLGGSGTVPTQAPSVVHTTIPTITPTSAILVDPIEVGLEVYRANGCTACHTLDLAGSTGVVGPTHNGMSETAVQRIEAQLHRRSNNTRRVYI
ncbi:MAG: protein kinase [Ardenticatenales bacterium]|nr:protein kinase [Ardenticatenales bacterium]